MTQPQNEDVNLSITEKSSVSKERRNWTSSRLGKIVAGAVLALEFNPLSNEALRLAALGATLGATHDPVLAATVFGASTLAIEGAGGIVTADVLDTPTAVNLVDKSNKLLNKLGASKIPKMNKPTEAAIAIAAGTPAVTFLKHRESPERTRQENRRYATIVSLGISAVTAVLGFTLAEGIHSPSPETISLAALGVGSFLASWKWARNRLKKYEPENQTNDQRPEIEQKSLFAIYERLRGQSDSPQNIGIDEETLNLLVGDSDVINAQVESGGSTYRMPVLIPAEKLYWYNQDLLKKTYGGKQVYFYTQIPPQQDVAEVAKKALKDGSVIIVNSDDSSVDYSRTLQDEIAKDIGVKRESLMEAFLNQYVGNVRFEGLSYATASSFFDTYQAMVKAGKLKANTEQGASILDVIKGEEAEELWQIYQKPFEDISTTSPINAGYDEKGFFEVLADPSVIKVVNRDKGDITTLGLFVTNFDHSPWINEEYYKKHQSKAHETGNILIFTGIVSDENKRGSMHSLELIRLLLKVGEERGTNSLITFECNEVSSNYLPRIVDFAINHSEIATVDGLDRPVAQSRFHTLSLTA